jgi:transcriptional regulator with XRE-family HTH domain
MLAPLELAEDRGEPWRKYLVTPDLASYQLNTDIDPERGIGDRIKYCRRQLDLSVEALSRYTKKFDREGVSRTTLVRYEAGDFLPGARELRVLADTFWLPVQWLLFGTGGVEAPQSVAARKYLQWFTALVNELTGGSIPESARDMIERGQQRPVEAERAQRQRWLHEMRSRRPDTE